MITVIGSLNMDIVVDTPKVPKSGETVLGDTLEYICGGKGANQAFACARLNADVTMVGCVGEDVFGDRLINNLKNNGVDTTYISKKSEKASGVAIITVNNGDNSIIVIPGTNNLVTPNSLGEEVLNIITKSDIIMLQLEIPVDTVEFIVNFAKEKGVPVMLNPAPAIKLSDSVFKGTTYFIVNESECQFYTNIVINNNDDVMKAIEKLKAMGVVMPIITLGSKGVVFVYKGELVHINGRKVNAIDTTAAGDTFAGALATKLTQGVELKTACEFANLVSSIVVQRKGAQSSIPTLDEVMAIK